MDQNQNMRLFELVATMTAPVSLTALQLADSLGTTRRNLYNYLHLLSDCGFRVVKEGTRYRLDTRSSFFRRLHENIALTDTEADYLCKRLADSASNDNMASLLRLKLVRQFGFSDIVATPGYARRISDAKAKLRNAMREERIVRIIDYSSPHSHTVSDRYVEPFMFLADTGDVRCHEISTHQNKTFKLSRMGGVEVLDDNWFNKKHHKQVYTDIFLFSGEEQHTVTLSLGQLSHNLMLEEYPLSEAFMSPRGEDGRWTLTLNVVSYLGIGRFVMGLFDDIRIIGDEDFKQFIRAKLVNGLQV